MKNEEVYTENYIDTLSLVWGEHWLTPGGEKSVDEMLINLNLNKIYEVLDFGCGLGGASNYLDKLGYNVTGVDVSMNLISRAKKSFRDIDFYSIDKNEWRSKKYDLFFLKGVLLHIKNKNELINQFSNLSNNNSVISISDWFLTEKKFSKSTKDFLKEEGIPFFLGSTEEYVSILENNGFKCISVQNTTQSEIIDDVENILKNLDSKLGDVFRKKFGQEYLRWCKEGWEKEQKIFKDGELKICIIKAKKHKHTN